jgi:deoxyribose-phosphate aldolase
MKHPSNKELFQFLDITTLNVSDTKQSVVDLVNKVVADHQNGFLPAAVCVYPNFSQVVSQLLELTTIATAAVAGCFPASQSFTEVKCLEAKLAVEAGATEIDIVINVGEFLAGNDQSVVDEVKAIKEVIGAAKLKVILETGALKDTETIKRAARIAILGGADFLKTSTGKIPVGATPDAVKAMCEVVKEEYLISARKIGIKVSGGVRSKEDALTYYGIIYESLGEGFCHPDFFRIGASSLADSLINE